MKKTGNKWKKLLGGMVVFLLCLCTAFSLKSIDAQAAAKQATASNGKYLYYSSQGTIYRMDTKTGKTKKIIKLKNSNWITDISYYKGYLYFTADYYYYMTGTDSTKPYVCRVKTNGRNFKKLDGGENPVVYGGKIYYERLTFKKASYGGVVQTNQGITCMNLSGSGRKKLISGDKYYGKLQIANDRIYYITGSSRIDQLYSTNLTGGDKQYITSGVGDLLTDGTDIYYVLTKSLHKISTSTGEDISLLNLGYKTYRSGTVRTTDIYAVQNGVVYFCDHDNQLGYYNMNTHTINKSKVLSYSVYDWQVGTGKNTVIRRGINGFGKYSEAIGKITKSGMKYKTLNKYYRP